MSSSDYDFDAPKYYDFQSSGYTEKVSRDAGEEVVPRPAEWTVS